MELFHEHDRCWSKLDPVRLAGLWDDSDAAPVYIGDEYLLPLIGRAELERHWGRIAARIDQASVESRVVLVRLHEPCLASITCLADWSLRTVESPDVRHGRAWVTVLARLTPAGWRFVHYVETPIYAGQDFDPPPPRVSYLGEPPVDLPEL